jgi:hypothetical protein
VEKALCSKTFDINAMLNQAFITRETLTRRKFN